MRKMLFSLMVGIALIDNCAQSSAQISLKGLKDKVTQTVKEKASETKKEAVQQTQSSASAKAGATSATVSGSVQNAVFEQTGPNVQAKGPKPVEVTVKSNIEDFYAAFCYYQDLIDEAIQIKDVSYLCSIH